MKRVAVIMAGGSGERFWPLSRVKKPKQLLKLTSQDKTMIEEAIERITPLIAPEDIYIITGNLLLETLRKTLAVIPPENIIAEPIKKNTAPALALSAAFIAQKYYELFSFTSKEISIAVLTADQSIRDVKNFQLTVSAALEYIETKPSLATVGIKPNRPETGYGYIEVDDSFDVNDKIEIKPVKRFTEKPDYQKAEEFVKSGNYLWNSGMFFWRLDVFIESMIKFMPEVGNQISVLQKKYLKKTQLPLSEALSSVEPIFKEFPNTSIDYGLMEQADNVVVVKALFNWDDIGSWDSLERIRKKDEYYNIISGNSIVFDTKNSILINDSTDNKVLLTAFGMDEIIAVACDDAIMICPKSRVQDVKKLVDKIKESKKDSWL